MNAILTPALMTQAGKLFSLPPAGNLNPGQTAPLFALGDIARSVYDYTAGPPTVKGILSGAHDAFPTLEKFSTVAGIWYRPVCTADWTSTETKLEIGKWDETKRTFDQNRTREAYYYLLSAGFAAFAKALKELPTAKDADALLRKHRIDVDRLGAYASEQIASKESITAVVGALMTVNAECADSAVDFFAASREARLENVVRTRFQPLDSKLYWSSWIAFIATIGVASYASHPAWWLAIFLPHPVALAARTLLRSNVRKQEEENLHDDHEGIAAMLEKIQRHLAVDGNEGDHSALGETP